MNVSTPLAYPAAGTLSAWWRQLASHEPTAGWVAHLFCHRVDAIVQVGTNLAMARLAGIAEFWLGKPVIAIITATYRWALRSNGIADWLGGFGTLLSLF